MVRTLLSSVSMLLGLNLLGPLCHERVLHLGHLIGVLEVRENQVCPHTKQLYVVDSPYQWYVPQWGHLAGLSIPLVQSCPHLPQCFSLSVFDCIIAPIGLYIQHKLGLFKLIVHQSLFYELTPLIMYNYIHNRSKLTTMAVINSFFYRRT
jgi:hypothetical protein